MSSDQLTNQIEGIVRITRQLESDLDRERQMNQKLAQEYVGVRSKLEAAVKQLQERLQKSETAVAQLTKALQEHRGTEATHQAKLQEAVQSERKIREELHQYKSAWSEVLARESDARNSLAERETLREESRASKLRIEHLQRAVSDARHQLESLHKKGEADRKELQVATIRLKDAEERFQKLRNNYELLHRRQQALEATIPQREAALRDQFNRQLETERSARTEAERTRENSLLSSQVESQKVLQAEQARSRKLEEEIRTLRESIAVLRADAKSESERMKKQISALSQASQLRAAEHRDDLEVKEGLVAQALERADKAEKINLKNQDAIAELRVRVEEQDRALSLLRLEKHQLMSQAENARKDASKELLVQKLKYEAESARLVAVIESLKRADLLVEKIDGSVDGPILLAHPLESARFSPNAEISAENARSLPGV